MSLLLTFGKKSVIQRALSVLRKYGTDAHAYIPGGSISTYGPELVTNGGFGSGSTGWTTFQAGWSASSGTASVNSAAAGGTIVRQGKAVIGNRYMLTFDVVSITSGSLIPFVGGAFATAITSAGIGLVVYITATDTTGFGILATSTNTVATIDNISVKEVLTTTSVVLNGLTAGNYTDSARTTPGSKDQPVGGVTDALDGIHATQGAAGNKPVLRQGPVNLLLNSATLSTQSVAVAASPYTLSFTGTGTVTKSGTATGALVGTGATDRVTQTFTPTAGTLTLTVTGSVTSAQLQLGSTATTYIPTTSAKASAGTGPSYWEFGGDGTPTDYLSLGSVPFQMSDDFVVVISGIARSSTPNSCFYGQARNDADSATMLLCDNYSGNLWIAVRDSASNSRSSIGPAIPLGVPIVMTFRQVSGYVSCRLNAGAFSTPATATLNGSTFTTAAVGCRPNQTVDRFLNGSVFSEFLVKGTITDADLLLIEKLAANLAGVTM